MQEERVPEPAAPLRPPDSPGDNKGQEIHGYGNRGKGPDTNPGAYRGDCDQHDFTLLRTAIFVKASSSTTLNAVLPENAGLGQCSGMTPERIA
jgi:hypothetical protein